MSVRTESRILLTTLILAGMAPGCYLLTMSTYRMFGVLLIVLGIGLLLWIWKPWKHFQGKQELNHTKKGDT